MREGIDYDPPSQGDVIFPSPAAMHRMKDKLNSQKQSSQCQSQKEILCGHA